MSIELLTKKGERELNWSDEFLLPLTGLKKCKDHCLRSYLFWRNNTINDYKLILTLSSDDREGMLEYARVNMYPILDKKGYLLESYDIADKIIYILDMSEWALDIEMFVSGKYSKMSEEAKGMIQKYHMIGKNQIDIDILSVIYPSTPEKLLNQMTPIEYVAQTYQINLELLQKVGEIGSIYDEASETLITSLEDIGIPDVKN